MLIEKLNADKAMCGALQQSEFGTGTVPVMATPLAAAIATPAIAKAAGAVVGATAVAGAAYAAYKTVTR